MKRFFIASFFIFICFDSVLAQTSLDSLVIDVSTIAANQDDPSIAIGKKNNNQIVVGAASDIDDMDNNGMPVYTSSDTGKTWLQGRLPLPANHQDFYIYGEADVESDDAGNFYYAYILNDGADSAGNISFAVSSDGKNWKNATPIDINIAPKYGNPDGIDIRVDNGPSSPHHGRVYAVWDQFYSDDLSFAEQGAYVAWSDNQCKTWSTPVLVGSTDDYQFIRTGKNGEVFIAASDSLGNGHQLFISNDGGATFTNPINQVFTSYPFFNNIGINFGLTGLKGNQGFEAFPYSSFDIDMNTGRIFGVFGDYQGDVATLSYSYSLDNGVNWTVPQIVGINTSDSADRFDPWVSVDQKTGAAYLLYYSSESDPKNVLVAPCRMLLSDVLPDIPQTLSPAFNPLLVEKTDTTSAYIGDHTSSDADGGVYAAAWTQNRTGFSDADVFVFISVANSKNSVEMPVVIHSPNPWLSSLYPNPSNGKNLSVNYYLPHSGQLSFSVYDELGKQVRILFNGLAQEGTSTKIFTFEDIPPGSYLLRMKTESGEAAQKFIISR